MTIMKTRIRLMVLAAALLGVAGPASGAAPKAASKAAPKAAPRTVYDFSAVTIDGEKQSLGAYKGKALLIVNTASKCGFTPQYEGLERLYQKYRDRGFEVLAFPENDFMHQEPGSNAEIKEFCSTKYHTSFPLFSKISVKGKAMHPLYGYLTREPKFRGKITWNFNKFLVDPNGKVIARFGSNVEPLSKELTDKLETILPPKS
jgi:glutathione peroxidase